jgi:hypothetical protein
MRRAKGMKSTRSEILDHELFQQTIKPLEYILKAAGLLEIHISRLHFRTL